MGIPGRWSVAGLTERLVSLHAEGRHNIRDMTKLLAAEFNTRLTKNAVIGKLHRLNLQTPKIAETRRKKKAKSKPAPRPVAVRPSVKPKIEAGVSFVYYPPSPVVSRDLSIHELTDKTCRFPVKGTGEMCRFCGSNVSVLPYCAYHNSVAIAPPTPSKRWK